MNGKAKKMIVMTVLAILVIIVLTAGLGFGKSKSIKDLAGRDVTLPASIQKVSCLHPIPTYMVWRLAPEKLISIDMVFKTRIYCMPDLEMKRLKSLPVTGVYFKGMNREQMLTLNPDLIVSMTKDPNLEKEQADYSAPVVAVSKDNLSDYEASFRLIGKLLDNEKEGNRLADGWRDTIARVTAQVAKIPLQNRVKVYYASHDGVKSSVGPKTVMASIIRLAGGITLYDTTPIKQEDDEHITVSMEQILLWNPEVIITKTARERDEIMASPEWKTIKAVKNNRVYASLKYEPLDGLQSIVGLIWTAKTLHPNKVRFDLLKETKTFYAKYFLFDKMTDAQILEKND